MMTSSLGQLVEITDVFEEPHLYEEARDDIWVFGYGSLMWLPDFDYRLATPARLNGWHRQFTCRSVKAWGTPERPGLSAALHPGGSVLGVAFAIAPEHRERSLISLNKREAAYRQVPVSCNLATGQSVEGLTFAVNSGNGRFLCDPDETELKRHILQGDGPKGTSLYYLESTVSCLNALGSGSTNAHRLLSLVRPGH